VLSAYKSVGPAPSRECFLPWRGGRGHETRVVQPRRLATILLAMTLAEAIETMRIHRVTGLTGSGPTLTVANLGWAPP